MNRSRNVDSPGIAKTVLTIGEDSSACAVISSVSARICPNKDERSFDVLGPVQFDETTRRHLETVVIPLARRIGGRLAFPSGGIQISVTNLAAASTIDTGIQIGGFSADLSVLMAVASTLVSVPVRACTLATGHIASTTGDIRMVKNLPAKLEAAIGARDVDTFILPDPRADTSDQSLSPEEHVQMKRAIETAMNRIDIVPVADAAAALRAAFPEERIILASLRQGYFLRDREIAEAGEQDAILDVLAGDLERRYWNALEKAAFAGDSAGVSELVTERILLHARSEVYPVQFGFKLFQLLQSLPQATRGLKMTFPLVAPRNTRKMLRLADEKDLEDLRFLLDAVAGDRFHYTCFDETSLPPPTGLSAADATLNTILSEIDIENLTRKVGQAIESARASYTLDNVIVQADRECYDVVASFYTHLMRHVRSATEPVDPQAFASEAYSLLERAFSRSGGEKAALAEARTGVRGGLLFLIDAMTARFKAEEQEERVNLVFHETWGRLAYDDQIAIIQRLVQRLGPDLPRELTESPPERYVEKGEIIIKAFVHSLEQIKQVFRQL